VSAHKIAVRIIRAKLPRLDLALDPVVVDGHCAAARRQRAISHRWNVASESGPATSARSRAGSPCSGSILITVAPAIASSKEQ